MKMTEVLPCLLLLTTTPPPRTTPATTVTVTTPATPTTPARATRTPATTTTTPTTPARATRTPATTTTTATATATRRAGCGMLDAVHAVLRADGIGHATVQVEDPGHAEHEEARCDAPEGVDEAGRPAAHP